MKIITDIFGYEPNRRKTLELFRWVQAILEVQLSEVNSLGNENLISEDVEIESDEDNRQFKVIISEILLFILTCLKEEDEDIKTEALKVNNLLQKKIIDILRNTAHTNSEIKEG